MDNHWCTEVAPRAIKDVLGIDLHPQQIEASLAMAAGHTVELLTGEGKTFAAIGAAMAYAAQRRPVHLVTANAYLARRDVDWSGAVLRAAGFTTGLTHARATRQELRLAYRADVVFGDVAAFGFDFLRDGLRFPGDDPVQPTRDVAIVDEADAVLLDQARTPLILTAAQPIADHGVTEAHRAARRLRVPDDVDLDLEHHDVALTDEGIAHVEALLGIDNLYDVEDEDWPTLLDHALRAHLLLRRDHDYVVHDGNVLPIDELTGRVAHERRWPDGLQQAVEAKEGIEPSSPRRPAGQCTVGSYFSTYRTVVGMSGTLLGADQELRKTYGTRVVRILPHRPVQRVDHDDRPFPSRAASIDAIADDTRDRHRRGQPVLIGTTSIADTADVSRALDQRGVAHEVLTAVNDHEEAAVIADAGRSRAVTVATQLAGRGVDIELGPDVADVGGLMVWGLGHHRSRRHDDQLRGRAGRQGDPGESCFATSPDDEITDQPATERLDRELRDDVRAFDAVTDRLHEHLAVLRAQAATAPLQDLLSADDHDVQTRRDALGHPVFDDAARLILRTLLVALWSETLEVLESQRALARIMPIRAFAKRRWEVLAVDTYREFERVVADEWRRQLLGFRVAAELPPRESRQHLDAQPPTPSEEPEPPAYQHHEWTGPSYNRFVRRLWYIPLPDLPLVLHLDAIGDVATHDGLALDLDLDDPAQTVVAVVDERRNAS